VSVDGRRRIGFSRAVRCGAPVRTKRANPPLFIAEFLRRLREAAHGEGVYMRVGDMFKDADVIDLSDW
jgi:hypothetical protein